jgi:hypothetical protein
VALRGNSFGPAVGITLEAGIASDEDSAALVGAMDGLIVFVEQREFGAHRRAARGSGGQSQFGRGGDGGKSAFTSPAMVITGRYVLAGQAVVGGL